MKRRTSTADEIAETVWEQAHRIAHSAADAGAGGRAALAQRGLAPQQLGETLASNLDEAAHEFVKSTRRPRKSLARNARRLRKDLSRSADESRRDLQEMAEQARRSGQRASREVGEDIARNAKRAKRRARPFWRRRGLWVAVAVAATGAALAAYVARKQAPASGQHRPDEQQAATEKPEPGGSGGI